MCIASVYVVVVQEYKVSCTVWDRCMTNRLRRSLSEVWNLLIFITHTPKGILRMGGHSVQTATEIYKQQHQQHFRTGRLSLKISTERTTIFDLSRSFVNSKSHCGRYLFMSLSSIYMMMGSENSRQSDELWFFKIIFAKSTFYSDNSWMIHFDPIK